MKPISISSSVTLSLEKFHSTFASYVVYLRFSFHGQLSIMAHRQIPREFFLHHNEENCLGCFGTYFGKRETMECQDNQRPRSVVCEKICFDTRTRGLNLLYVVGRTKRINGPDNRGSPLLVLAWAECLMGWVGWPKPCTGAHDMRVQPIKLQGNCRAWQEHARPKR